jgi:hypothetical protein
VRKLLSQLPERATPQRSRECERAVFSTAFIAIHAFFKKNRIRLGSRLNDNRSFNLNMMLKVEFKKIKVNCRLIKVIKYYHIHFCSTFNSSIEKSYVVSPVIVALVDYPF